MDLEVSWVRGGGGLARRVAIEVERRGVFTSRCGPKVHIMGLADE